MTTAAAADRHHNRSANLDPDRLRRAREEAGLSIAQLAALASSEHGGGENVDRRLISGAERGTNGMSAPKLKALASALTYSARCADPDAPAVTVASLLRPTASGEEPQT